MKAPLADVDIKVADAGFYAGYRIPVALVSKLAMTILVLWALIWPGNANAILGAVNGAILNGFNTFYIIAVGVFAFLPACHCDHPANRTTHSGR